MRVAGFCGLCVVPTPLSAGCVCARSHPMRDAGTFWGRFSPTGVPKRLCRFLLSESARCHNGQSAGESNAQLDEELLDVRDESSLQLSFVSVLR